MKDIRIVIASTWLISSLAWASALSTPLLSAPVDLHDQAALQRGAGAFMHYCAGCHGLSYERYNSIAEGIGLVDEQGKVLDSLVMSQLNFVSNNPADRVVPAMDPKDAATMFGTAVPDLTLVARVRGKDWLYNYLKGFYRDPERPFGVNNVVFKDVGMPHVLGPLQGEQFLDEEHGKLVLITPGQLTTEQYDRLIIDLVSFLDHVAEPVKLERQRLGGWVILGLMVFLVLTVLLKREYWKNID